MNDIESRITALDKEIDVIQCDNCQVVSVPEVTCPNCGRERSVIKHCVGTLNEDKLRNEICKQREHSNG